MAYARWSTQSYLAGVTYSADRFTATFDGSAVFRAWSAPKATSGKLVVAFQINAGCYAGVMDTSSLNTAGNENGITVRVDGNLDVWTSGGNTTLATIPSFASGSWIQFYIDMGAKKAWATADGSAYYGAGGATFTGAQVLAGTGGISISMITAANLFSHLYFGSGTCVICSGASAYPFAVLSGYGNFSGTLFIDSIAGTAGYPTTLVWDDGSSCGTLQYSIDGGALTNASGTVSGTGGTATTSSQTGVHMHSIYLTDGANTLDQTDSVQYWTPPPVPPGATPLVSDFGTLIGGFGGPPPRPHHDYTWPPTASIGYTFLILEVRNSSGGGVSCAATWDLYADAAFSDVMAETNYFDSNIGTLDSYAGTLIGLGITGTPRLENDGRFTTNGDMIETVVSGTLSITAYNSGTGRYSGNQYWDPTANPINTGILNLLGVDFGGITGTTTNLNLLQASRVTAATGYLLYGIQIYDLTGGSGAYMFLPVQIGM